MRNHVCNPIMIGQLIFEYTSLISKVNLFNSNHLAIFYAIIYLLILKKYLRGYYV